MDYYFSANLELPFEETAQKVTEALKTEGFGVISVINIDEKLKEKLGVDFKKYRILGACNPGYAYKALQAEDKIGTMLPCNVILIDQGNGITEVAAINPIASMMAITNDSLGPVAMEVTARLEKVIGTLKG